MYCKIFNNLVSGGMLQNDIPVVPISIHEVPARFASRITDVKRFGTLPPFNPVSPSAWHCFCSAGWQSTLVSASCSPCRLSKGAFQYGRTAGRVSGVAAHGRLHTVNVSNRIPLPRRKLTLLVPKGDPVAVKKLLVSQVSSLARLRKVSEKDARSCQDIMIALSVSPNEFLPITGY